MFVADQGSNYDQIRSDLLGLVFSAAAPQSVTFLGGTIDGEKIHVPVFNKRCVVERKGIYTDDRLLDTIGSIIVLRYFLQSGSEELHRVWAPYRDLKDGAPFSVYIKTHIEDRIARQFTGKPQLLLKRFEMLGGSECETEINADLTALVYPLPKLPVLCVFRDADEEFGASFQFLFDRSATCFLDLEALAAVLRYIHINITEEV